MKEFYVEDYYIWTKNKDNWKSIKGMLDLPIWKSPTIETKSDDYENELKEIAKKKKLNAKEKNEAIRIINDKKFYEELNKVRITHGAFLRAIGDVICEKGDPPSISAPSIKNKFETLVQEEYETLPEEIIRRIKDGEWKGIAQKQKIEDYKKIIDDAKQRDLNKLGQMNAGRGIIAHNEIDALNRWLDNNRSAFFIKKVGENYRLLVYYAEGIEGKTEYFCSRKNRDKFIEIVNKNKWYIQKLKDNFENINGLLTLGNVLKPPTKEEMEFFPRNGPYKYNFENGWVIRRLEVNDILKKIKENGMNKIQLLEGKRASGKTVIARNVGYKLMEDGWLVFQISANSIKDQVSTFAGGINYLEKISNKSLIIIENIHRDPYSSANLIQELLKVDRNIRFLITTIESFERYLPRDKEIVLKGCSKIELKEKYFDSVAKSIINNYLRKNKNGMNSKFEKITENDKDKIISKSKGNLWILSYFLRAWKPEIGIDMEIVYGLIIQDIEDLNKELIGEFDLGGTIKILLTLAPFSIYEVGVSKSFFNKNLGVIKTNPTLLKKLVKYGEIIEENGCYLIPHSTLAELYLKSIFIELRKGYMDYVSDLISQLHMGDFLIDEDEFTITIIKRYLKTSPKNIGLLLYSLYKDKSNLERIPPKKLLLDDEILLSVSKAINMCDLSNFQYFISILPSLSINDEANSKVNKSNFLLTHQELKNYIETIDFNTLISKFEMEANIDNISIFIDSLHFSRREIKEKVIDIFINKFHPERINKQFKKGDINYFNYKMIYFLLRNLPRELEDKFINTFLPKIYLEEYIHHLLWPIEGDPFIFSSHKAQMAVFSRMDPNVIFRYLCVVYDLSIVYDYLNVKNNYLLSIINNKKYEDILLNYLPPLINESRDLNLIIKTLIIITAYDNSDIDIITKIINKINKKTFKEKFNINQLDMNYFFNFPGKSEDIKQVFRKFKLMEYITNRDLKIVNNFLIKNKI
jgi:hypothetical protein